jgi:hypothetical protein
LYGSADDEMPFLRHRDGKPPLDQNIKQIEVKVRRRKLPAAVHAPHGFSWGVTAAAAAAAAAGRAREARVVLGVWLGFSGSTYLRLFLYFGPQGNVILDP